MALYNMMTTHSFTTRATTINAERYDYSLVDYINSATKVKIKCNTHNTIFEMTPNNHLKGHGCKACSNEINSNKQRKPVDALIVEFENIHGKGKYGYEKVGQSYTNNKTDISIFCNTHQQFFVQAPVNHLRGCGCPICAIENTTRLKPTDILVSEFIDLYGDSQFDYTKVVNTGAANRVEITCMTCGHTFKQTPSSHLRGNGCPRCKESSNESRIRKFLSSREIANHPQWNFSRACKNPATGRPLTFDFYLPDYNLCIEFDGIQHSRPFSFSSDQSTETKLRNFKSTSHRDQVKNQFCVDNGIHLVRISHTDVDNIEQILTSITAPK